MTFDAVVLAGGRGRRLGDVSKPEVVVAGRALLDRALDATAGARRVVVVGPDRLARPGVVTVLEDPPGGGPVAGLDAGLAALTSHAPPRDLADGPWDPADGPLDPADGPLDPADGLRDPADGPRDPADGPRDPAGEPPVLVLACDVPRAAGAVPVLLAALDAHPDADGAHLVRDGHAQLVAVHRPGPLRAALAAMRAAEALRGAPVRALLARLRLVAVPDDAGLSADADTWDDVARLESVLAEGDTMTAQTPDDLDRWARAVADALGVDPAALDRDLVLDLTRDVAHAVARPAVPLTTFLMGMAVGAGAGDRAALEAAAGRVAGLAAGWGAAGGAGGAAGSDGAPGPAA